MLWNLCEQAREAQNTRVVDITLSALDALGVGSGCDAIESQLPGICAVEGVGKQRIVARRAPRKRRALGQPCPDLHLSR